jgi:hypothetical protein
VRFLVNTIAVEICAADQKLMAMALLAPRCAKRLPVRAGRLVRKILGFTGVRAAAY